MFRPVVRTVSKKSLLVSTHQQALLGKNSVNNSTRQSSEKILYSQQAAAPKIRVCGFRSSWILRHVTGSLVPDIETVWWIYLQSSKRPIIDTLYIEGLSGKYPAVLNISKNGRVALV